MDKGSEQLRRSDYTRRVQRRPPHEAHEVRPDGLPRIPGVRVATVYWFSFHQIYHHHGIESKVIREPPILLYNLGELHGY